MLNLEFLGLALRVERDLGGAVGLTRRNVEGDLAFTGGITGSAGIAGITGRVLDGKVALSLRLGVNGRRECQDGGGEGGEDDFH